MSEHSVDPSRPRVLEILLETVLGPPRLQVKRALLDTDGCEAQTVEELDHRQQLVAALIPYRQASQTTTNAATRPDDEPQDSRFGQYDPARHLFIEVGTGYNSVLPFNPGEPAAHIAGRICRWNDVCRLRRLTDAQVAGKVEEALVDASSGRQGLVALWALDLGEAPFGFSLDTGHLSRCTSCVHKGVPPPPPGTYPEAPKAAASSTHSTPVQGEGEEEGDLAHRVQLMVDSGAISSMEGLDRVFTSGRKVSRGAPVIVKDRPWEDSLFGAYPCLSHNGSHFMMWYWATKRHVAYAHSTNGVEWFKPSLGAVNLGPLEGGEGIHTADGRWDTQRAVEMGYFSTELSDYRDAGYPLKMKMLGWPHPWREEWRGVSNNLVTGLTSHATVMRDPNDRTGAARYKALYECHHAQTCLATSPDGVYWRV